MKRGQIFLLFQQNFNKVEVFIMKKIYFQRIFIELYEKALIIKIYLGYNE
jgi:hypothetical protein